MQLKQHIKAMLLNKFMRNQESMNKKHSTQSKTRKKARKRQKWINKGQKSINQII
jgi:hypothetical protein